MSHAPLLLMAVLAASPTSAASPASAEDMSISRLWTVAEVGRAAADHSPAARLLESERTASACGLDREDAEACARVGLIQAVYGDLAAHQRGEAAAEAMSAYWRAVALRDQLELLSDAEPLLDTLEALADAAERLEIADGDRDQLADQRLQMEDRRIEASFSLRRLRSQIAALTGKSLQEAEAARFGDSLGAVEEVDLDVERQIQIALAHRSDLRALETLCRCMTGNSLPAARDLMSTLSPGLGIAAATATAARGGGLLALHHARPSIGDLACRRSQCHQLVAARRDQIRSEVRDAVLQIEEAVARAEVARRRAELADTAAQRAVRATEIEQQPPGSGERAELQALELQANLIEKQLRVAESLVELKRVQGIADN